jgi:hypothetical protein
VRSTRPLACLLVAGAAGLGALALREPAAPPATVVLADGARPAPSPVLQMIGLAAPTVPVETESPAETQEAELLARLDRERETALPALAAFARRWPARAAGVYDALVRRWLAQRLHALALRALGSSPLAEDSRATLRQQVLDDWAITAPDQAARWALATPGAAERLAPLQDRWLQQDARSATMFAVTLPPGELRDALLAESLSRWAAQDGAGARDWLRATAPQPELDEALARHGASDELARASPAEAIDLVARIASPERRWQAWQALAGHLHDIDPAQAAGWIARAPGLDATQRQLLLDVLR